MRWVRRIGLGALAIVAAAAAGAGVYFYALHPKLRAAPTLTAPRTAKAIARGKYLAFHVAGCVECHTPVDESRPGEPIDPGRLFAGRVFDGDLPGRVVAPNLTSDPVHGLGRWTDGEIARAIREGVDREGHALFPIMPYRHFRLLTDEDTLAIVAYLRTVPPITDDLPRTDIDFPVSMFVRAAPAPLTSSPPPWPTDPVARGKILLEVMGCVDCHTPLSHGQPVASLRLAGGMAFPLPFGTVYSPNITPDPKTGIGDYTEDDILRVLEHGTAKDGRLLWVMPWPLLGGASEQDLRAVAAALHAMPPIAHDVPALQYASR